MADGGLSETVGSGGEEGQARPLTRGEKLLRLAVYIMGVILVVGTIVLVVAIIKRASNLSNAPPAGFGDVEVPVPQGSEVARFEVDGNRLALHIKRAGANEIVIIDLKDGKVLGRVRLTPKAP